MIVVLRPRASEPEVTEVLRRLEELGLEGRVLRSWDSKLVHVVSACEHEPQGLRGLAAVEDLVRTRAPAGQAGARPFYPYHFINWCIATLLLFAALALLAGFLPPGLGPAVDLQSPPAGIDPPWYFRGLDQFLSQFSPGLAWVAILIVALSWAVLLLVPVLDRSPGRSVRDRPLPVVLGAAALLYGLYLSLRGLY